MLWQNNQFKVDKGQISYFAALSLLFSYIEFFLPRFVPFLKLGLGNIVILCALEMQFIPFFFLILIKTFAACLVSGTLFSPFFLISICQSVISGIVMYEVHKIGKRMFSIFGISVLGAVLSGFVQICLTAVYLGREVYLFTGPIIIFSIFSGIVTAHFSKIVKKLFAEKIDGKTASEITAHSDIQTESQMNSSLLHNNENFCKKLTNGCLIFVIVCTVVMTFLINNIYWLIVLTVVSFIGQLCSGRKIKILPFVSLWTFVILCGQLSPSGKVIFDFFGVSFTEGAFELSVIKGLKLTAVSFASQVGFLIHPKENSFVGMTLRSFAEFQKKLFSEMSKIKKMKDIKKLLFLGVSDE